MQWILWTEGKIIFGFYILYIQTVCAVVILSSTESEQRQEF